MSATTPRPFVCSFCGLVTEDTDNTILIKGALVAQNVHAAICAQCVEVCVQLLAEHNNKKGGPAATEPPTPMEEPHE